MSLKASGLTGCSILIARLVDLSNDSLPGKEKVRNMGRGRVLTSYIITGYPELLAQSANIGALARGGNPERMAKDGIAIEQQMESKRMPEGRNYLEIIRFFVAA